MNKRYLVKLDKDERRELSELVKKDKIAARKRTHAQVLLLADAGRYGPAWTDEAIAEACQVTVRTTENILTRETRISIPPVPGRCECFDYEYERNGTANVFAFTEPLTGWRHIAVTDRRTKTDWAHQIRELVDVHRPQAERITLVMDNLNTHTLGSLYEAFSPQEARRIIDRLDVVYTPKHGSWLNMAEIELNVLTRQCLSRRIPDKPTLIAETTAWQDERNRKEANIDWQFTTEDARTKLKHLYPKNQS